ncbi:energy-coupled thiamine transporter ThiT [Rummeliibacillus sp. TYF005]|uniref:energy-coupled thiamine transporter ThiT n=1 Tax=Rummeliibacillus sp. TYF005 TaxID=2058214 RepID=UPI000F53F502|nr:energy-coupled thiamine transporter ThiT [Rummeliibacillus sp. TYF005]RPJ95925.1 energy-coupled thiamine transporter ThiT [Rummeliibacillus sp. TYF005]
MNNKKLLMMIEIAIFAAIGLVLDQLSFRLWAQGGSISLVMVPIVLMSFRWGTIPGLVTGFLIGTLQAIMGGYILTPLQGFIDYFFAFTVVGLAGIIRRQLLKVSKEGKKKQMVAYITLGTFIGGLLRYIAHTVAGIVFFAEYAGKQNVYLYSIIYNGSYMIPAIILTIIVASLLFTTAPKLLEHKR